MFRRHVINKKTPHAAEQDQPGVKATREARRDKRPSLDSSHLVFIDETGTATNMTRLPGRAIEGLLGKTPHSHRKTTTFVAALRHDRATTLPVIDGAMNCETFVQYFEQFFVPTLASKDIVIMYNLADHRVAGVKTAIVRADISVLYLPASSPALNPIGMVFSKLNALLRKVADRTVGKLWDWIGDLLGRLSSQECRSYPSPSGI